MQYDSMNQQNISMLKRKIAVSQCLLGDTVRYDGRDSFIYSIARELADRFTLVPVCPETGIGLGVPRPPVQLVDKDGEIRVVQVDDPAKDYTTQLQQFAEDFLQREPDICGYIFKSSSPSCGIQHVKVLNQDNQYQRRGTGLQAAMIMQALPDLPVIDEIDFMQVDKQREFLWQVECYQLGKSKGKLKGLHSQDFWNF